MRRNERMGEGELGVSKDLKYVVEKRVLCFLLTTEHPVPPLTACRQQLISGPGRSSKRKQGKYDPYGGTIKLTADLQASSKPGQAFITTPCLASSSHTWPL